MSVLTNMNIKSSSSVLKPGTRPYTENQKTRMCKNMPNCAFGNRCHYAHRLSDLKIASCAYGTECIFINHINGCYTNNNDMKICYFRHPDEKVPNYNVRSGNAMVTPDVKPCVKHPPRIQCKNIHDSPLTAPVRKSTTNSSETHQMINESERPVSVETHLIPIKLNFDTPNISNRWVTVRNKNKQNTTVVLPVKKSTVLVEPMTTEIINVNEADVFELVSELLEKEVTRIHLNIKY